MRKINYNYICNLIGNLSGVPIRLYNNGKLIFYHSLAILPKDPMTAYEKEILAINEHIGYFITPTFHYYGVVSDKRHKIVVGPTIQTESNDQTLRELALRCNVPTNEAKTFVQGMKSIVHMPLNSIMQMLCAVNYIMNDETLSTSEITIYDSEQENLRNMLFEEQANIDTTLDNDTKYETEKVHNTLSLEQTIMNFIRKGDKIGFDAWLKQAPAVRGGIIAGDQLRQLKNTFVVTTTLACRAAIDGGMDSNDALALSDAYIRKCELLNHEQLITDLQLRMLSDYTECVNQLRIGEKASKFLSDIANYVRHNLSRHITTEDIAEALYISRSRMSVRFKSESGINLSDYIVSAKIEEAKRLLSHSDESISSIGAYLAFSSQSHFTRQFKKILGCTPGEYRKRLYNKS